MSEEGRGTEMEREGSRKRGKKVSRRSTGQREGGKERRRNEETEIATKYDWK